MIDNCTGCGACMNICPKSAIKMIENEEGFLYPVINKEKCANCNLCKTICPKEQEQEDNFSPDIYAAINKNKDILMKSSSGGVFFAIAEQIIKENGYVCGCVFGKNLEVSHILTNNMDDIKKMRGSKYVQSNTKNTFGEVKKKLEEETKVLYAGTPCQIAGLKKFLNKDYEDLLTIDLICHGVPSQKIFKKYIEYLSKELKSNIVDIKFRNKSKSGSARIYPYELKIILENGKTKLIKNPYLDSFYAMFHKKFNFRKCCYECKYANENRVGDITLGDFWGIEYCNKCLDLNNGTSMIMINNQKARKFFNENLKDKLIYEKHTLDELKLKNLHLTKSNIIPEQRNLIYKELNTNGYEYIMKKYSFSKSYIMLKLKTYVPLIIKKFYYSNIKFQQKQQNILKK